MPNHIHGILIFNKTDDENRGDAINCVSTAPTTKKTGGITGIHNPLLHENLGRVIRWFKGRVSFECRAYIDFGWQERFYDRIIRDNNGLNNVREYIFKNPVNWRNDEHNAKLNEK
jgi:REP element-mobilizing transposase RayT